MRATNTRSVLVPRAGKGPLAQFDIETGLSLRDTEFGLLAFILFFFFAAINPGTGRFVDEEEEVEAPAPKAGRRK